MKITRNTLIAAAAILVVLAAAWFLGGGLPAGDASAAASTAENSPAESMVTSAPDNKTESTITPTPAEETAEAGTPAPTETAPIAETPVSSPTATAESPAVTAAPSATPDPTPSSSAEPTPSASPDTQAENGTYTCTLSVSCATILGNPASFNPSGVLFPAAEAVFYEGETVFNVLQREMKKAGIQMEFTNTPLYNSAYIEGIGNIYERDCGELSGWMYRVGGVFPGFGCSRYTLQDGDVIEFVYTCDLGRDVGGDFYANTDTEGGAA
jgi:hypothetical protein